MKCLLSKNLFPFLPITCFLLCGIFCHAQPIASDLTFDRITEKQGLSSNVINDIIQDSHGFLWIATDRGLNRYDGYTFKNYITLGPGGITDKVVHTITEDKEGNIWFGTENGLNKLNPFTDKIIQYFEGNGPGTIPAKWCNRLYVDKQKNLWLTTEKGVALYNTSTDSFENFPVTLYGKDSRNNKFISGILEDSKGHFWLSTSYGVKLFDRKTKTYKSYHKEENNGKSNLENVYAALFEDYNGTIWAGTFYTGLLRYNEINDAFEKVTLKNINTSKFTLTDIAQVTVQSLHYILIATDNSLISANIDNSLHDKEISSGITQLISDNTSRNYNIRKIFTDRQGTIWAASASGLFRLKQSSFAFNWLPVENQVAGNNFIYHIIPDIKNPTGIFYLTTNNNWFNYNKAENKIIPQTLPPEKKELLSHINAWVADNNGYWFSSVKGFGYYDIYNNRVRDMTSLIVEKSGQNTTGLIIKDDKKRLWITMRRNGILVYNPVTGEAVTLFADKQNHDNTVGENIRDLVQGPDGKIYFTAINKLYIVNPSDFSYKTCNALSQGEQSNSFKANPGQLFFTKSGRLLITSGLFIYELKNNQLVTVYPEKGFMNYDIEKITPDAAGNLWIKAEEGYYKTDTTFSKWYSFNPLLKNEEEGLPNEVYTGLPDEVLFTGTGKLGILNESLLQKSKQPAPVIISRIKTGEKENYLLSLNNKKISGSYKDAIEIELSPVNFLSDKETKVLYQLDGWDKEWKELTASPVIRYEQLPPGSYVFKTKAINAAGIESQETLMTFRIIPPFYSTWWFISLSVLLLASAAYLLYCYRLRKAVEMERLRTRIATDLHDDIGATLSSISMYSEAVKNQVKEKMPHLESVLNKMGENSRDMVTSMSDIVWAINPGNDDGEKLTLRMENYARDICSVKNVQLHFMADEKLNEIKLPLEHRKNIYLVFKEALNNSLKYSSATEIGITISRKNNQLQLTVKDNGKGFNTATTATGNGLKNMQLRAKEINATLQILSAQNEGTVIELSCTV